jgi:hypothetical protein
VFGTHYWRDEFIETLEKLSGRQLINLDPTKTAINQATPEVVVGGDSFMIDEADLVIVYLTDDISVGGSQEILIAKYFQKPVIGLAPLGGKFNGGTKEYFGKLIHNYKDPFVFSTCDVVCADIAEVAEALKTAEKIKPKSILLIKELRDEFEKDFLKQNAYLQQILKG